MNDEDPIERCDREIAAMRERTDLPAWIVALTISDWEEEKRWLLEQADPGAVLPCARTT